MIKTPFSRAAPSSSARRGRDSSYIERSTPNCPNSPPGSTKSYCMSISTSAVCEGSANSSMLEYTFLPWTSIMESVPHDFRVPLGLFFDRGVLERGRTRGEHALILVERGEVFLGDEGPDRGDLLRRGLTVGEQQHSPEGQPGEGDPRNQAEGPTLTRLGDAPHAGGERRDARNRDDDVTPPAALGQLPEVANERDVAHAVDDDDGDRADGTSESVVSRSSRAQPGTARETDGHREDRLTRDRHVGREPLRVHVPERV